jgi:2-succinyl-6-hydroxy-2,4-cyclohexadiene-1-carboxylate synthase
VTRIGAAGGALEVSVVGQGPPLLLLHGFTGSSASWSAIAAELARSHRVIVPDLLGHGRSDAPHESAAYALARQARILRSVLVRLEAGTAVVVGYSMGARLALHLALEPADSLRALVLESPSAGIADPAERARRRADDERWAQRLEVNGLRAFVDAWESQPLFANQAALPADVRQRQREERLGHDPLALAASLRGAGQGVMEPLHERIGDLRLPTLVVAGALDTVGLIRAREVAELIPGARAEVVTDAGHTPHLETPGWFIGRLVAFLDIPTPITAH